MLRLLAFPDSKVRVANMGPTWFLAAPGGPHVGPMNLAIRVVIGCVRRVGAHLAWRRISNFCAVTLLRSERKWWYFCVSSNKIRMTHVYIAVLFHRVFLYHLAVLCIILDFILFHRFVLYCIDRVYWLLLHLSFDSSCADDEISYLYMLATSDIT